MEIKNIVFDLSEVIIMGYVGVEKLFEERTGISSRDFLERRTELNDDWCELMRGKMTEEQYWKKFLSGVEWPEVSVDLMERLIRRNMQIMVPGTLDLIYQLTQYRLILMSDHVRECMEFALSRYKWMYGLFKARYFSYELGKLKGDPGAFEQMLTEQGINADETIFIDDRQDNVKVAMMMGIDSIIFTTARALEQELRERRIVLS